LFTLTNLVTRILSVLTSLVNRVQDSH